MHRRSKLWWHLVFCDLGYFSGHALKHPSNDVEDFVYRCHDNFGFIVKYILPNFNPKPIIGENFTSIRIREDYLKAD